MQRKENDSLAQRIKTKVNNNKLSVEKSRNSGKYLKTRQELPESGNTHNCSLLDSIQDDDRPKSQGLKLSHNLHTFQSKQLRPGQRIQNLQLGQVEGLIKFVQNCIADANSTISELYARIDLLTKENHELKKLVSYFQEYEANNRITLAEREDQLSRLNQNPKAPKEDKRLLLAYQKLKTENYQLKKNIQTLKQESRKFIERLGEQRSQNIMQEINSQLNDIEEQVQKKRSHSNQSSRKYKYIKTKAVD